MFFLFFMPTGMQNVAVLQEQGAGLPRTYFIPLKKRLMCAQEVEALREAVADAQAAGRVRAGGPATGGKAGRVRTLRAPGGHLSAGPGPGVKPVA